MIKQMIVAILAIAMTITALPTALALKRDTFPTKYELIGICSTTRTNSYGFTVEMQALDKDRLELANGDTYIPLLIDHEMMVSSIIGKVTALDIGVDKTLFKAEIQATHANRAVIEKIKSGSLVGVSIGFDPILNEGGIIRALDLVEISLVVVGADPGAMVLSIKEME